MAYPASPYGYFNETGSTPTESPQTHTGAHLNERKAINAIIRGFFPLSYDTTGATGAGQALQDVIDLGHRKLVIPPGIFLCDKAVFDDLQDGNAALYILAHGVIFKATTSLPTVTEIESFMTTYSRPTGMKAFLFPSVLRAALSGGVVTVLGNHVPGTATLGGTRVGVSPHLIVEGGTWDCQALTKYNGGFCVPGRGGAVDIRSMHMSSARALVVAGCDYIDGNKMTNPAGWGQANMDATYDAALFYQVGSGDAVYIQGAKTDNYIRAANLTSCNGAYIKSIVGGSVKLNNCHAIKIDTNHTEVAANIAVVPRNIYEITDSHVTIDTSFDYVPESQATAGGLYIDDSGLEGRHSRVEVRNWLARHWLSGATDPGPGYAVYINKMNNRTRLTFERCFSEVSPVGLGAAQFSTTYGLTGILIGGNATNEPTLAAAVTKGSDFIGSGTFQIIKTQTSTMATGQNNAMNIEIGHIGPLSGKQRTRVHITPTLYDFEDILGVPSTLAVSTTYAYSATVGNVLPDGTFQPCTAMAESTHVTGAAIGSGRTDPGSIGFEMYFPTGAHGATVMLWRKTATGVLTTPDRYILIPIGTASGRFIDSGANVNSRPWITTSVPVPNTIAAINHTKDMEYLNGNPIYSYTNTVVDSNNQTGTTYTLAASDVGKVVEYNNASAITTTVPPNSSVEIPVGAVIELWQQGAGQVTVAAGAGVTIRSPSGNLKLAAQYAGATLRKRATDEWALEGHLTA